MLRIGIFVVLQCYFIVGILCFLAIKLTKKVVNKQEDSFSIATKSAILVVAITLNIYFIPLILFLWSIVCVPQISSLILLPVILSAFIVPEKVIIPILQYLKYKRKEDKENIDLLKKSKS